MLNVLTNLIIKVKPLSLGTTLLFFSQPFYIMKSSLGKACLITGISFGTAWAIRGHFGHEHGAIWAAAIGVLTLLVVSNRADWLNRALTIVLASALGWGISGGVMSYGLLIGYSHATDFLNSSYGLLSLFVVGSLYGCLGGGLLGLALSETDTYKVDWPRLIVEMVVGGLIAYFFIIMQFEWLMTPPRDENWAFCFGATLMLFWYLTRHGHSAALKVALWSALGAGFGFASGNFLQVVARAYEIKFNFWNVMEYSIGFWGGIGMTYGVLTNRWPVMQRKISIKSQWLSIVFFALLIPFIVWEQAIYPERVLKYYTAVELGTYAGTVRMIALALVLGVAFMYLRKWLVNKTEAQFTRNELIGFTLTLLGVYILNSFILKGAFFTAKYAELYLYIPNFLFLYWILPKTNQNPFHEMEYHFSTIGKLFAGAIAIVLLLAFIAMHTHGAISGMEVRFQ